jgi:hypothetical protein
MATTLGVSLVLQEILLSKALHGMATKKSFLIVNQELMNKNST